MLQFRCQSVLFCINYHVTHCWGITKVNRKWETALSNSISGCPYEYDVSVTVKSSVNGNMASISAKARARGVSHQLLISAEDAFRLLEIKHNLPHRQNVNIQGVVTSVSPIMRINKDCLFLVELEGSTIIVVKQTQFHKWHHVLSLGNSFIFTDLRPTSLSKSFSPEQRVFVPWKNSQLLMCQEDQPSNPQSQFIFTSLQKWLEDNGVSDATNLDGQQNKYSDTLSTSSSNSHTSISNSDSLTRYQGIVSDTSRSSNGIYELDSSITLFLCYLPNLKHPLYLHQHDTVTVENIHLSVNKQTGEKQLYCCTKTSISVQSAASVRDRISHNFLLFRGLFMTLQKFQRYRIWCSL